MQEFIHNIAALFKVKTIISLVCIFVFAYLAIKQIITPDNVMTIVSMVIAFYFGTQAGKVQLSYRITKPFDVTNA